MLFDFSFIPLFNFIISSNYDKSYSQQRKILIKLLNTWPSTGRKGEHTFQHIKKFCSAGTLHVSEPEIIKIG